jgi:hypothetical protein
LQTLKGRHPAIVFFGIGPPNAVRQQEALGVAIKLAGGIGGSASPCRSRSSAAGQSDLPGAVMVEGRDALLNLPESSWILSRSASVYTAQKTF